MYCKSIICTAEVYSHTKLLICRTNNVAAVAVHI